jgi:hypothetical protein
MEVWNQNQVNKKPSRADHFGIKRTMCKIDGECPGYETNTKLFAGADDVMGEFPTFCKHCQCPAHFHEIEQSQLKFPENLSGLMSAHNIQTQDLNFNCVMAAFVVMDEDNAVKNTNDISMLIEDEGLEIISATTRYLQPEDQFFLRARIVASREKDLQTTLGTTF